VVGSVLKALNVLELFSASEPRLTLAEISRRLELPKSTAHNTVATLAARGYLEKLDTDHYALGIAVIPLTRAVRWNVELRDRAAPLLRELADTARSDAYLTVLDHDRAVYIFAVESTRRLLARTTLGSRAHLHCTGVGKAMLAFLPAEQARSIVKRTGLTAFTDLTITDAAALFRELAEVRARGYAIDRGEHEHGVYCMGAPILNDRGTVVGACSVSGTDPELLRSRRPALSSALVRTAQEISRRMGYVPPRPSLVEAVRLPSREKPGRPGRLPGIVQR
jgi:DNA-binding IclR family transcriptional regulator